MRILILCGVFWIGCEATDPAPEPLELPAGCNPLMGGIDCFLPYPSDVYLVDDASLPSGKRVEHRGASKLTTDELALVYAFLQSISFGCETASAHSRQSVASKVQQAKGACSSLTQVFVP